MKTKSLILAGLALAALVSCSKENKETPVFEGDKAYINVNIVYSDAATRGTGDSTNPFWFGTAEENKAETAYFFFYNADGTFATFASKEITWSKTDVDKATSDNIERIGNGVVVLSGLKSTNYPTYMSVVLNPNGDMVTDLQGKSIAEAKAYIIDAIATEGTTTKWTDFVMTSSSANNGDANTGYFCEKLDANNFQETAEEAKKDANTVTAYVERLAAKVKVGFATTLDADKIEVGSFMVNGTVKTLYCKVSGWGLNATAKESYVFKNIEPTWAFAGFSWNDYATNHRSYWGKSTKYGLKDNVFYPANYAATTKSNEATTLDYVNYNALAVKIDNAAYCRENTNTVPVLSSVNFSSAVTSVLLQAQVVDENGAAVELVNYGKKLYTFDNYVAKVLSDYKDNNSSKRIFTRLATPDAAYNEITASYIEVKNEFDGNISLKAQTLGTGVSYYFYDGTDYKDATADEVTAALNGTSTTPETLAQYYKTGMMYYNIPIEHLNDGEGYAKYGDSNFKANLKEASYGVVRNHYYMLTVNSIKNLGKAVYDAEESIIPSDDDLKDYYVGAKVNILSWKVVKQEVNL